MTLVLDIQSGSESVVVTRDCEDGRTVDKCIAAVRRVVGGGDSAVPAVGIPINIECDGNPVFHWKATAEQAKVVRKAFDGA